MSLCGLCFIRLSTLQRNETGGGKGAQQPREKPGMGEKQSSHVVSLQPSIALVEAARACSVYIFKISSVARPSVFFLSLAVNSPCLHLSFFQPNFLSACQETMSFFAPHVRAFLLTFLLITSLHLWFTASPVLHKLSFFSHTQRRKGEGVVPRT